MHQFSLAEKQEEMAAIKLRQLGSCLYPDTHQGVTENSLLPFASKVR